MLNKNTEIESDLNILTNLPCAKRSIWLLLLGALLVLSGVYVIFNPITALLASAMFIGLVFILLGAGYLLVFRESNSYMMLALGILDLVIGVLFLANIGITAVSMPIVFALWTLFNGITEIVMGIEMKQSHDKNWPILFWGGIGGLIFSFLIFAYPIIGTVMITALIGTYLIVYGILEIVRYLRGC